MHRIRRILPVFIMLAIIALLILVLPTEAPPPVSRYLRQPKRYLYDGRWYSPGQHTAYLPEDALPDDREYLGTLHWTPNEIPQREFDLVGGDDAKRYDGGTVWRSPSRPFYLLREQNGQWWWEMEAELQKYLWLNWDGGYYVCLEEGYASPLKAHAAFLATLPDYDPALNAKYYPDFMPEQLSLSACELLGKVPSVSYESPNLCLLPTDELGLCGCIPRLVGSSVYRHPDYPNLLILAERLSDRIPGYQDDTVETFYLFWRYGTLNE